MLPSPVKRISLNFPQAKQFTFLLYFYFLYLVGVTRKFHMASIAHGVHLLRMVGYDRQVSGLFIVINCDLPVCLLVQGTKYEFPMKWVARILPQFIHKNLIFSSFTITR